MSLEESKPGVEAEAKTIAPEASEPFIGRLISERYEILSLAGEGAMGAVYRARHTFMDKDVAIKILHKDMTANSEVVERFRREAQAAAHIEHPNVCSASDFGRYDDESFFLVMEWLEGTTLEEVIARADLPVDRALNIAAQMGSALERAHALGIVHRDLKPANIMLVENEGEHDFVKVTDFGVARVRLGNSAVLTQAGMAYGTPSYMAPEQAAGEDLDHRADIYALGIIVYEMLTGRTPFIGEGIAHILSMHVTESPPPFEVAAPHLDIPGEVERFIFKCLEKDPADRFQDAAELVEALESLRNETPTIEKSPDTRTPQPRADDEPEAFEDVGSTESSTAADSPRAREPRKKSSQITRLARTVVGQVTALEPKKRRALGLSALAVVIVAAGLAISFGLFAGKTLSDKAEEVRQVSLAEERAEFSAQPEIASALSLQATGATEDALRGLERAQLNYESNAHFHYLFGNAQLQESQYSGAFDSLGKAVELDSRYETEPGLQTAVLNAAQGSSEASQAAAEFLKGRPGAQYHQPLFEAATTLDKRRDRKKIADFLETSEILTELESWQRTAIVLRTERKCSTLKDALDEAASLEEPRLKPMVQYVNDLPTRGCGFLNRSDCYSCLRSTATKAMEVYGDDDEESP